MGFEDCQLDIENILECPEKEAFDVLERLRVYTREIEVETAQAVDRHLAHEKEFVQKCEAVKKEITELHRRKKEIITELDEITLKKKVVDRKLAITANQHETLLQEIEALKSRKESLSVEMVDLMQENEDRRKKRKDVWSAIKRACAIYRENLNYHIDFTSCQDHESVKIAFFKRNGSDPDTYYVNLLDYNNSWKVDHIEPALKKAHLKELRELVDTTKPLDVLDVIICLCKLRDLFLNHYLQH